MANFSQKWERENISDEELYLDLMFSVVSCTALFFTLLVGITANLFVIWAVQHQKCLQTSNNTLLVSLAAIDLLRSVVDCPLLLAIILHLPGRNDLGALLCYTQIVSFSFCSCVQLITLACISAERYHAIAHPFENGRRRRRVIILITMTWIVSIFISFFSITMAEGTPVYTQCRGVSSELLPAYNSFGLYILVPLWLGCLVVISGFYGRIFIIVRNHSRKVLDDCGLTASNRNNCRSSEKEEREEEDRKRRKSNISGEDVRTTRAEPGKGRQAEESVTQSSQQKVMESHKAHIFSSVLTSPEHKTQDSCASGTTKPSEKDKQAQLLRAAGETMSNSSSKQLEDLCAPPDGVVCALVEDAKAKHEGKVHGGKAGKEHFLFFADGDKNKHKESQLAKRSGYIIFMFLMFWTPLILSAFANFLTGSNKTSALHVVLQLDILSISLACMTSASNPVVYAAVNPHFRTEFRNMKAKWKAALCYNSRRTSCQ
ncbi:uncharacterized protein LOC114910490 [Scleropages formosus]|uniref:uncharacterized protein LOC114910490 n=1 Tax=Scleropages formosus TaxID=113540 RepID=UPI0010FA8D16|nr:uncharacterized protein LOC114910490 [Scleropages formosus]